MTFIYSELPHMPSCAKEESNVIISVTVTGTVCVAVHVAVMSTVIVFEPVAVVEIVIVFVPVI
ncbi:unknown [Acinetobacter sp. CAG:196]|nr:unknown [Acinetobacter sp. CAG:196]